MTSLKPGQNLLLNDRVWMLRQIHDLGGRNLQLEAVGVSAASQGMARNLTAVLYGDDLFIRQNRGGYWHANISNDWLEGDYGPLLSCKPASQLELLSAHTRFPAGGGLKNEFSWSYSRASKYRFCSRAYYYHYYASWEGWQQDAVLPVKQAYLLKNLTDIPRWGGILVHDSIKYAIARLKAGQPVADDDLIEQMHRRARADIATAQSDRFRQQPNQFIGFQEHFYQTSPGPEIWHQAKLQAEAHLRTFINSRLYDTLRYLPSTAFLNFETLQSFFLADTKIWVQLDLAVRQGGGIRLYDWKTGRVNLEEAQQQLGVYGLYIRHSRPDWADTGLKGTVYDLSGDRLIEFELAEDTLQRVQSTIEASIADLQQLLLDPQTNLAELRRFPMIADLNSCRRCQFRALCGR